MRCPSCGADISDPLAAFCPHCAAPLGDEHAEATTRLDVPADAEQTSTLVTPEVTGTPVEHKEPAVLQRAAELHDRLDNTGWLDVAAAAALGFLVLLVVGGLLVVAAKLNFPSIGAGADLLGAFTAIVMAGLGSLGIPIVIDGLVVSALPLGALLAIGAGIMWGVRTSSRDASFTSVIGAVAHGARVGVPFGLLCWFFALVFRLRGQHPVGSDAGVALLAGLFWGGLFGALGAVRVVEHLKVAVRRISSGLRARDRTSFEGASTGLVMLSAVTVLGAGATLLWIIAALARGAPGDHFGAGDAFAYLVYLAAFFPNIIVAIVSLSVGGPLDVGAKVNLGGELVGPLREYSLATWGRGDPPGVVWLLMLVPLLACALAGFVASRRATDQKSMVPVLLIGSAVFAVTITLVGAIGRLRMAGVVKGSGYGVIEPRVAMVLMFAFLISGIVGFLGWNLAQRTDLLSDRFPQAR